MKKLLMSLSLLLSVSAQAALQVQVKAACQDNVCEKTIILDEENNGAACSESCKSSMNVSAVTQEDGSIALHYRMLNEDGDVHAEGDVVTELGKESTVSCEQTDASVTFVVTEQDEEVAE